MFIFSCSEDNHVTTPPPDPPYQYGSASFDWKVDTLFGQGFYAGFWAKIRMIPKVTIAPTATQLSMDRYSFDNILVPGQGIVENCFTTLFHRNGIKWSLELCGYWVDPTTSQMNILGTYQNPKVIMISF